MKPSKPYLNENEAAEFLGVSAAQLRTLIRSHVTTEEADLSKVGITQFQPADLLLLRFLIGQSRGESATPGTFQLAHAVSTASGDSESGSTLPESAVPAASLPNEVVVAEAPEIEAQATEIVVPVEMVVPAEPTAALEPVGTV